jgi:hypothetical protein
MDVARAEAMLAEWRWNGRALRFGLAVRPLELPRSRRVRRALEAAAADDPRIRAAVAHSAAASRRWWRRDLHDHGPEIF